MQWPLNGLLAFTDLVHSLSSSMAVRVILFENPSESDPVTWKPFSGSHIIRVKAHVTHDDPPDPRPEIFKNTT